MSATTAEPEVRLVRPYALTGGRTRSQERDLPLETLVLTTGAGRDALSVLLFERAEVVRLCDRLQSVAEVSAQLALPLGVARVLVGDLHAEGLLDVHRPGTELGPDVELLEKVLDGLQRL